MRAGPISWEVFKKRFLDRFFESEKQEEKVEEFINLRQGGMNVQEYLLKCMKLSKYVSSLVTNSRDEMSHYVTGVSDDLLEVCHAAMLQNDMDLSSLMVLTQ